MRPSAAETATRTEGERHLDDADLIRELDGEPPLTSLDVIAHVRDCDACAGRMELIRHRRKRLVQLLAESDVHVGVTTTPLIVLERARTRTRWYRSPALRAAAMLIVAGTLAAQPAVRYWAARQWERLASSGDSTTNPAPVIRAAPAQGDTAGGVLSFEPGVGPFTIRFDSRPVAGTLTVLGDSGSRATAERTGGENAELLITSHGFHVRNTMGGTVSYRVSVPRSLKRVTLQFGASPSQNTVIDVGGEPRVILFGDPRAQ